MRPPFMAATIAGLLAISALIALGGQRLDRPVEIDPIDLPADFPAGDAGADNPLPAAEGESTSSTESRPPEPETGEVAELERVAPREPLSKLSLALPPKPKMPDDWKGTVMFGAVAKSAGLIEAKGYTVAIAGVDIVDPEETCSHDGKSWDCGVRARTAFRAFLRGRAPSCAVPPQAEVAVISASCKMGKVDVGHWLVSNGWARATAGGVYVEAQANAEKKKLGIFGRAPAKVAFPDLPASEPPIDATVREPEAEASVQ